MWIVISSNVKEQLILHMEKFIIIRERERERHHNRLNTNEKWINTIHRMGKGEGSSLILNLINKKN